MKIMFSDVLVSDSWGYLDVSGFHLATHARDALDGIQFGMCKLGDVRVAVFLESSMEVVGNALASLAGLPDWIDRCVCGAIASPKDSVSVVIDAQSMGGHSERLDAVCAFALACVSFAEGRFLVEPNEYRIVFASGQTVIVNALFDWDAKTWYGSAETP
jgi:hypothetical protein